MELPESYVLSRQVNENLRGKCISEVKILQSHHRFAFFKGDVDSYPDMLEGQNQFALYFDDETALICTIRMYGIIHVYPKGADDDGYYESSSSKPDPLSEEFTYGYFRNLYLEGRKLSAKAFLATEQRIPGLGNGVLQDILWDAGIDPRFPMAKATEEDFRTLYASVVGMLRKMCEEGGRDVENDLFGRPGGYISQLSKKSLGEPCMRCGTEIQKAAYMGGTVYFCEKCQRR